MKESVISGLGLFLKEYRTVGVPEHTGIAYIPGSPTRRGAERYKSSHANPEAK